MNCDQAFDCLTDPQHRDLDALQCHLDACSRCRDLAEALQPALTLFDEASSDFGCLPSAPEIHCSDEVSRAVPRSAQSRHASKWASAAYDAALQSHSHRHKEGAKIAVVLLLIGAFTAALAHVGRESSGPLAQVAEVGGESCLRERLDATTESAPALAACLACHLDSAESRKFNLEARQNVQRIVKSCVVCHLDMLARQEIAASDLTAFGSCERRLSDG